MSRGPISLSLFARSDVGLVRTSNEDSFAVAALDDGDRLQFGGVESIDVEGRGPLLVVCDGMGGAAAGEVASRIAVDVMLTEMSEAEVTEDRSVFGRHLRRAVRTANRRVYEESGKHWKLRGMGTTLSAAGVLGTELIVANVGDSRAYILRGDALVQVTRDQSVVSALLHAGRITEEEAKSFQASNVILQALGVADDVEVALSVVELRRGDRLLLCSDGLCGPVDDDELRASMVAHDDLQAAVNDLIQRALDAGGPDNVTVIVARFDGDGLPEPASEDDLPKFVEFDPMEEGTRQFTTTSRVAHRLAARAGVGEDTGPAPIPATGQHAVVDEELEPATAELAERARIGLLAWVMALIAILAVVALLAFGR